eukprot:41134-Prorocentrum_minimum.AAC.1
MLPEYQEQETLVDLSKKYRNDPVAFTFVNADNQSGRTVWVSGGLPGIFWARVGGHPARAGGQVGQEEALLRHGGAAGEGKNAAIKPLLSRSATGNFNSPPNCLPRQPQTLLQPPPPPDYQMCPASPPLPLEAIHGTPSHLANRSRQPEGNASYPSRL